METSIQASFSIKTLKATSPPSTKTMKSLLLISLFQVFKFRNPPAGGKMEKLRTCKAPTLFIILCGFAILILFPHGISSQPSNNQNSQLHRGSTLSVESQTTNFLISPDKTFTCGFYVVGQNAYWSIWLTDSADRTVVWTANRNRPVNAKGSKLSFRPNSGIALTNVDGFVVWETNKTPTDASLAELLNSGNLVLKNPQGKILWQSFDSPTDTLLSTQLFTKSSSLVSNLGLGDYGSGYFNFLFDDDNTLRMIYDGPDFSSIYWPNPDFSLFQNGRTNYNSSRSALLDEMGSFVSSDSLWFSASDYGLNGVKRRLTVDSDGNLRLYSLNSLTGSWVISWQAIDNLCSVHGICGRNGICLYTPIPKCSCPPGYQINDPKDWSKGCKPVFEKSCLYRNQVKFLKVPHVDFWGFELNFSQKVSLETCMDLCLDDCQCDAFSYRLTGEAVCYTKSILFNGYRSPAFRGDIYLKLPRSVDVAEEEALSLDGRDIVCENGRSRIEVNSQSLYEIDTKRVRWVYLYSFACAMGAIEILLIGIGCWFLNTMLRMPESVEMGYHTIASQFRRFSYRELKKATKNFKEELGRGGSGVVYKGVLGDERVVAVKRLGDSYQGEDVLWAEVTTIGKINHMNLVRMWGFCSENRHRMLVYEYLENQSLDNYIFSSGMTNVLEWEVRFKVALGTAKGLAYLHHECLEWVIHCDVKPENILLDDDFEPKIADFGLAKLSLRDSNSSHFTKIRGTKGYMAPEWASNLPITAKVDVYSYGVVILELVKGIRLSNMVEEEEEAELARFIKISREKIMSGGKSWVGDQKIVDPKLKGKFSHIQAAKMVEIGLSCVDKDRNKRPTMDIVVQSLLDCQDYRPNSTVPEESSSSSSSSYP